MKKPALLFLCILSYSAVFAQTSSDEVLRLSEPVQETEKFEVFGEELNHDSLEPNKLSEVLKTDVTADKVTLITSVSEVCTKKGCFFIAQDGDFTARVTFKDYGFFIPTDSKGKEVILVGELSIETLTEEKAKHYAEDMGKDSDDIVGDQKEYSIVATSVIVPKTK